MHILEYFAMMTLTRLPNLVPTIPFQKLNFLPIVRVAHTIILWHPKILSNFCHTIPIMDLAPYKQNGYFCFFITTIVPQYIYVAKIDQQPTILYLIFHYFLVL